MGGITSSRRLRWQPGPRVTIKRRLDALLDASVLLLSSQPFEEWPDCDHPKEGAAEDRERGDERHLRRRRLTSGSKVVERPTTDAEYE